MVSTNINWWITNYEMLCEDGAFIITVTYNVNVQHHIAISLTSHKQNKLLMKVYLLSFPWLHQIVLGLEMPGATVSTYMLRFTNVAFTKR